MSQLSRCASDVCPHCLRPPVAIVDDDDDGVDLAAVVAEAEEFAAPVVLIAGAEIEPAMLDADDNVTTTQDEMAEIARDFSALCERISQVRCDDKQIALAAIRYRLSEHLGAAGYALAKMCQ